jgi:hypothetical protein
MFRISQATTEAGTTEGTPFPSKTTSSLGVNGHWLEKTFIWSTLRLYRWTTPYVWDADQQVHRVDSAVVKMREVRPEERTSQTSLF